MKTKKLTLNDFEAIGTGELLEIKGGDWSRPHVNHSRHAILAEGPGGGGGGGSPCGTRINSQGFEESPLPISTFTTTLGGSNSSNIGTSLIGMAANRLWKTVTGIGGSFFSTTSLNSYGHSSGKAQRFYVCPNGMVYPF